MRSEKGDRTGPSGMGPGTGRALGFCYGYDTPGYVKGRGRGMGRGSGFGRGMGMGRGRGAVAGRGDGFTGYGAGPGYPDMPVINKEDEIRMLKSQIEAITSTQKSIEKRLEELGKE